MGGEPKDYHNLVMTLSRSIRNTKTASPWCIKRQYFEKCFCNQIVYHLKNTSLSMKNEFDGQPLYEHVMFNGKWKGHEHLQKLLKPLALKLEVLGYKLTGKELNTYYVFLRKYAPEQRSHLGCHVDDSALTFSIMLSDFDDYEGGEFYVFSTNESKKIKEEHRSLKRKSKLKTETTQLIQKWLDKQDVPI